jgi:hypothetical protein
MPEKIRAMAGILNKFRLAQGWGMLAVSEAEKMVMVWIEILDLHKIPAKAYPALYTTAMKVRAGTIAKGKPAPDLNAELLASLWLSDPEISKQSSPKALTTSIPCKHCKDTGWRLIEGTNAVARCRH